MSIVDKLNDMGVGFEAGPGLFIEKRPALVMIHGAGGRSRSWQNQIGFLKDSMNVLALDLPGHGKSVAPGKASVDDYATWLSHILGSLFNGPVFLAGHSLGGAIVQKTALLFPQLVEGIILASTGPRLKVYPILLEGLKNSFEETVDMIIKLAYASDAERRMLDESAKLMKQAGAKVVHDDFFACDQFDVREELKHIKHPCHILCGDEDKLTPPQLSGKLNESIKGSTLSILEATGHMIMMEKPEVCSQAIQDFVVKTHGMR
ncbi:MAG: alpha/beta hydrolase [Desulfobacterales bacterium]|nr:alpha/beta hydrolase [Desulfobacterales bacterium]